MKYSHKIKKILGINHRLRKTQKEVAFSDYDSTWEQILKNNPYAKNAIPSAFVDWDNTPRKQKACHLYTSPIPRHRLR